MKMISNKDGDILSQFDNINENDIPIHERNYHPKLKVHTIQTKNFDKQL